MHSGAKTWIIPGGQIPLESSGPEPACTSREELHILNTGPHRAQITLTVYYEDRDPAGPYVLVVKAQRTRAIRMNDLIDPLPIPLAQPYSVVLEADHPVFVQFIRINTARPGMAFSSLQAYPVHTTAHHE